MPTSFYYFIEIHIFEIFMHAWTKIILKMKKFVSWKRKRYSWLYSSISFIFSIIFMSILLLQLWTLSYSFFITFLSYNAHKIQLFQRKPEQSFSCQTLSSYSKVVATMVRSQWVQEFLLGTICAICSLLFFLIWNARGGGLYFCYAAGGCAYVTAG